MAVNNCNRKGLFDHWSERYDSDVDEGEFPFIGYRDVLTSIIRFADMKSDHRILDLGVGTGNLAKLVPLPAQQIWGADFSDGMLKSAREALPGSHLIQVDLQREDWPAGIKGPFDRVISAYTFHEFSDQYKMDLIQRLSQESLAHGGLIVIGDISFKSLKAFNKAHQAYQALWDEDEAYWCADQMNPSLEALGCNLEYQQVSSCGVSFVFREKSTSFPPFKRER